MFDILFSRIISLTCCEFRFFFFFFFFFVFFVDDSIIVRCVLHPGFDQMSYWKQIDTIQNLILNYDNLFAISPVSFICFLSHKITHSSCLTKRKSAKLNAWWILWLIYAFIQYVAFGYFLRMVPGLSAPKPSRTRFFRPGHLVPLFGSTRPIFNKWGLIQ